MLQRMKVFADDSVEAMAQITRELGGDARIYSTRQVNGGIEIIAGPDEDDSDAEKINVPAKPRMTNETFKSLLDGPRGPARIDERPKRPQNPQHMQRAQDLKNTLNAQNLQRNVQQKLPEAAPINDDRLRALEETVAELKSMMRAGQMADGLRAIGATPELISVFLARSGAHDGQGSEQKFSAFLAQRLHYIRPPSPGGSLRVIVAVGPSGSGKTTLLGQIAARLRFENPAARVALVNAENNRIARTDQLRAYGRILDVPVVDIDKSDDLGEFSRSVDSQRSVLIDMPSNPEECAKLLETIHDNDDGMSPITRIGVVPANLSPEAIGELLDRYSSVDAVAITKLSESSLSIPAIGQLSLRKMGIAYLSKSANLTSGLVEPEFGDLEGLIHTALLAARKKTS